MAKEKNKTAEEKQDIRQRWHERCLLNQIKNLLPEGYVVINKKPVQKQLRRRDSIGCAVYWSSWCKKDGETFLALLDLDKKKLKIIPEETIRTEYYIRSI